jgi:pimeloyl-ACP methyl ester carboxylesterase
MSAVVVGKERRIVHYEACGRGPPVIFLHGWLGSWRYWVGTMEEIGIRGFRAYAFDFWGFGDSGRCGELCSVALYTEQLRGFIDEVGIVGPVVLVGHALGAAVALEFAALYPDAVSRLVSVCTPVVAEEARKYVPGFLGDSFSARRRRRRLPCSEIARGIEKTDALTVVASLAPEIYDSVAANLLDSGKIRPTLVIYGSKDEIIGRPPLADQYSVSENGSLQVICMPDSGHFPMVDARVVFNRLLVEFSNNGELHLKEYWVRRLR